MNDATINRSAQLALLIKVKLSLLDAKLDQVIERVNQGEDSMELQIKLRDIAGTIESCSIAIDR